MNPIDPIDPIVRTHLTESSKVENADDSLSSSGVDSGLSSIEKSKSVIAVMVPVSQIPLLSSPSKDNDVIFAIESFDVSGKRKIEFLNHSALQVKEIENQVLESWAENLRVIEEQVRKVLCSPQYLSLQESYLSQNQPSSVITGATSIDQSQKLGIISAIDKASVIERLSNSENKNSSGPSEDIVVLSLAASFLIGGASMLNSLTSTAVQPVSAMTQSYLTHFTNFIESLGPIFSNMTVENLIPLINLMITAPIYYHSWDEAVSHLKNRESHNQVDAVQNFAKDVIKMTSDRSYNVLGLIQGMPGLEDMSLDEQARLASMLKFILVGVALSLMYGAEVGKISDKNYGGILPQEVKELLINKKAFLVKLDQEATVHQKLMLHLIERAHEHLSILSSKDREKAISLLLDFVDESQDMELMLEPKKVFKKALDARMFDSNNPEKEIKG